MLRHKLLCFLDLSGCLDAPTSPTLDLAAGCRHPHGGKDGLQPTLQPQPCSGHAWTPAYQCIHGADLPSSEDSSIDWGETVNSAETLLKWALLSACSPFACEVLVRPFRIFPMKESHHKSWKNTTKNPTSDDCWGFTFAGLKRRFTLCGFVWDNIDGMGQAVKDLGMTDLDRFGLFLVAWNPVLLQPNCEHMHISSCLINLSQIW